MTKADSEKRDKRRANRAFRRLGRLQPEKAPTNKRAVSDVWNFAKDGKFYLRKDSVHFQDSVMRK